MKLPTYQELADLVAQLTEANIANVDIPEDRFVSCYTYGADRIPDHWWRAIAAREALIAHQVVSRGDRSTNTVIRDRSGKAEHLEEVEARIDFLTKDIKQLLRQMTHRTKDTLHLVQAYRAKWAANKGKKA